MTEENKRLALKVIGLIISTLPPTFCVLSYFPIWAMRGAKVMLSGLSLCLILISAIPLFRAIKTAFRSPSAPMIWFTVFIVFFTLSKIADDITVIALVGFISNLLGTFFFRLSKRSQKDKEV